MREPTIRERVARARVYLSNLDCAIFTTFNFNADFFEENALPCALGVQAKRGGARKAEVNELLATTPTAVFFDHRVARYSAGDYRYLQCPVVLKNGLYFHPKNIILAGTNDGGERWVYISASSANLSMSGWGRNAEGFAETWIHTKKQQAWDALRHFLRWLTRVSHLASTTDRENAPYILLDFLKELPDRKRHGDQAGTPWNGTLRGRLYFSPIHKGGLASFIRGGRKWPYSRLVAYSPYWRDVAARLDKFQAREVTLVPALLPGEEPVIGLGEDEQDALPSGSVWRNRADKGDRFWHAKIYLLWRRASVDLAIGSCNFTRAGLAGGAGNVESMILYKIGEEDAEPYLRELEQGELPFPNESEDEERPPASLPVAAVVFYDWQERVYRWWIHLRQGVNAPVLVLPGGSREKVKDDNGIVLATRPPGKGAGFTVHYRLGEEACSFVGRIVEINLHHSARVYGRPLAPTDIFNSWKGRRVPLLGPPTRDGSGEEDGGGEEREGSGDEESFNALSLYEMYRAFRDLRARLAEHASAEEWRAMRAQLATRSDSVIALSRLVIQDTKASETVRFLVLTEATEVLQVYLRVAPPGAVEHVGRWLEASRGSLLHELGDDLKRYNYGGDVGCVLDWFEDRLRHAWGEP